MYLKMSDYGSSLSNRLKCRSIVSSIKGELFKSDSLTIDFKNIDFITASFGTELFDSIFGSIDDDKIKVVNVDHKIESIVSFCLRNIKEKSC